MKAFNSVTSANAKKVNIGSYTSSWNSFQEKPEYKKNVGVNRPSFPKLGRHQKDQGYKEQLQSSPAKDDESTNEEEEAAQPSIEIIGDSVSDSSAKFVTKQSSLGGDSTSSSDEDSDENNEKKRGQITMVDPTQSFCFIDFQVFGHGSNCTSGWPLTVGDTVEYYREKNEHPKNKWKATSFELCTSTPGNKRSATGHTSKQPKKRQKHAPNHLDAVQALASKHSQSMHQSQQQQQYHHQQQQLAATWMSAVDSNGRTYYYHSVTRQSTYQHPGSIVQVSNAVAGSSNWVAADSKLLKRLKKRGGRS
jgi:hypothetical protein